LWDVGKKGRNKEQAYSICNALPPPTASRASRRAHWRTCHGPLPGHLRAVHRLNFLLAVAAIARACLAACRWRLGASRPGGLGAVGACGRCWRLASCCSPNDGLHACTQMGSWIWRPPRCAMHAACIGHSLDSLWHDADKERRRSIMSLHRGRSLSLHAARRKGSCGQEMRILCTHIRMHASGHEDEAAAGRRHAQPPAPWALTLMARWAHVSCMACISSSLAAVLAGSLPSLQACSQPRHTQTDSQL
jgi:hypothetical protein